MNKTDINCCDTDTKRKIGIYFSESPDGDRSKSILNVTQGYIDRFSSLSADEKDISLLVAWDALFLRNRLDAYNKLLDILAPYR